MKSPVFEKTCGIDVSLEDEWVGSWIGGPAYIDHTDGTDRLAVGAMGRAF